ncbi:MAG: hypothetical protein ACFE0O_15480 [Opitutales bacterium]
MIIISHRGYWKTPAEKNTPEAFRRSFGAGYGTETDIRDCGGELVIAHDPPDADALTFGEFLEIYAEMGSGLPLALNVKADGLQPMVRSALEQAGIPLRDVYFFDMSVPDTLGYAAVGLPFYCRHSDLEPQPALYEKATGVWLDAFFGEWYDMETVRQHLDAGKAVALVSPDLHKRPHEALWMALKANPDLVQHPALTLCTDFPEDAKAMIHA